MLYVIEVNPGTSRSVPVISKIFDISLIEIAIKVAQEIKLQEMGISLELREKQKCRGIKVPVFPFRKISEIDIKLDAEMKSTGEVLCIGNTFIKAAYKALIAAGYKLLKNGDVLIDALCTEKNKLEKTIKDYEKLGFNVYTFSESNFDKIEKIIERGQVAYVISAETKTFKHCDVTRKISILKNIDLILTFELSDLIVKILKNLSEN